MKSKTVFITGATSGIGKATALGLAKAGYTVHFHGRNAALAAALKAELDSISGNKLSKYFIADFLSQQAIRKMAKEVKAELDSLDILINNAGAVFQDFQLTEDGIERTIALNHFSYFLLSHLLLDLLEQSDKARIINVASRSNLYGKVDLESFTQERGYHIIKAYSQSKLVNIFFTQSLAEKLASKDITVNCLHPGVVKTAIGKKGTSSFSAFFWKMFTALRGISVEDGAETSLYLATSDEVAGISGQYFSNCKIAKTNKVCKDKSLQDSIWEKSLECCPLEG